MDKDQFKKGLKEKGYKWREEGECIIIEEPISISLIYLKPEGYNVHFRNRGSVYITYGSIGDNIYFRNGGFVYLDIKIPVHVDVEIIFRNEGDIYINGKWLDLKKNITFPESRWTSI